MIFICTTLIPHPTLLYRSTGTCIDSLQISGGPPDLTLALPWLGRSMAWPGLLACLSRCDVMRSRCTVVTWYLVPVDVRWSMPMTKFAKFKSYLWITSTTSNTRYQWYQVIENNPGLRTSILPRIGPCMADRTSLYQVFNGRLLRTIQ